MYSKLKAYVPLIAVMLAASAIGVWAIAAVMPEAQYKHSPANINKNIFITHTDTNVHNFNIDSNINTHNPIDKLDINELNRRLLAEGLAPIIPSPEPHPIRRTQDIPDEQQPEDNPEPESNPIPIEIEPPTFTLPQDSSPVNHSKTVDNPPPPKDDTSKPDTSKTDKLDGLSAKQPGKPSFIPASYDHCPKPPYPPAAERRGIEGKVVLRVKVGIDGSPQEVRIISSSGNIMLDRTAADTVTNAWRFKPASCDGINIESWVEIPVAFELGK